MTLPDLTLVEKEMKWWIFDRFNEKHDVYIDGRSSFIVENAIILCIARGGFRGVSGVSRNPL